MENWLNSGRYLRILPMIILVSLSQVSNQGLCFLEIGCVLYAKLLTPGGWKWGRMVLLSLLSRIVSSKYVNHNGCFPFISLCSLGERCCHLSNVLLSAVHNCSKYRMLFFQSCFLKIWYLGCWLSIGSRAWSPLLMVLGHNKLEFATMVIPRCCRSWIIWKLSVSLLRPSMSGCLCWRILVVDQRLFWSCCSLILVEIPRTSGLLSLFWKLVMWCCSWMSQIFRILYICGFSIVLFGVALERLALCLAVVRYLDRIVSHMVRLRIMLCSLYSMVEIITVLMI